MIYMLVKDCNKATIKKKREEDEYKVIVGLYSQLLQSPVPKTPPKTLTLKTDMIDYIMACQLKKFYGLCQSTI